MYTLLSISHLVNFTWSMNDLRDNTADPQELAALAAAAMSGQPVGWAAVAQAVRDFDEQQVQDCKEDIDTLLTFVSDIIQRITLKY